MAMRREVDDLSQKDEVHSTDQLLRENQSDPHQAYQENSAMPMSHGRKRRKQATDEIEFTHEKIKQERSAESDTPEMQPSQVQNIPAAQYPCTQNRRAQKIEYESHVKQEPEAPSDEDTAAIF